jgi:hypothetical protein
MTSFFSAGPMAVGTLCPIRTEKDKRTRIIRQAGFFMEFCLLSYTY